MNISRRDALVLTPVALLSATPALALKGGPSDARLIQLENRWQRLHAISRSPDIDDETLDRSVDIRDRVEDEIFSIPAQGPDGMMVKLRRVQYWIAECPTIVDERFSALAQDAMRLAGRV